MYKYILLIASCFLAIIIFTCIITPYKGTGNTFKGLMAIIGFFIVQKLISKEFK